MKTVIFTNPLGLKHDTGNGHPETPLRLSTLFDLFSSEAPFNTWRQETSFKASFEQLNLGHSEDYIFKLQELTPDDGYQALDSDTILSPNSYDAATHAVGATCRAVNHVIHENEKRAFCAIRPAGHHATYAQAMGFCLFNNIFIAARHAQTTHDIKKIAIVDFDVHHGNGTQDLVRKHNIENPDHPILFCSTHGAPMYPHTGEVSENNALIHNTLLPLTCTSDTFKSAYTDEILPKLDAFAPELLLISAGFDAHKDDPLAPLKLIEDDFYWVTQQLCKIADTHCQGRIVSALEGGYNLEALKTSVKAHLLALSS